MSEVRPATLGDLPGILELDSACFSRPWAASAWRAELDHGALVLVVGPPLPATPALTGLACALVSVGHCELRRIAVEPRARGVGLGGDLLQAIISRAHSAGCTRIELEVADGNIEARSLYRTHGFEVVGRRRGYYRSPPDDALLMDLGLGPEQP